VTTAPDRPGAIVTLGHRSVERFALATALSVASVLAFVAWAEADPDGLRRACVEDGPIEWLSAICYLVSSAGFLVTAFRSEFLRRRPEWWIRGMTLAWALLMFAFFGEEISWGQRLLGIQTPEWFAPMNRQKEINLHNIFWIEQPIGGVYRLVTIMILMTGLVIPVAALTGRGRRLLQRFAFPVLPWGWAALFLGCFLYDRYYPKILGLPSSEVREFLLAVGMMAFGLHAAWRSGDVFRDGSNHSGTATVGR
jgi:hypothetical protein